MFIHKYPRTQVLTRLCTSKLIKLRHITGSVCDRKEVVQEKYAQGIWAQLEISPHKSLKCLRTWKWCFTMIYIHSYKT